MNCEQFDALLLDLDRAGSSAAASRANALSHAEGCSRCAALLCESEALDFALAKLVREDAEVAAPARLEAALTQRFRREQGIARHRGVRRMVASFAAVAAVGLLALGLSLRHRARLPQNPAPPAWIANSPLRITPATPITPGKTVAEDSPAAHGAAEKAARPGENQHEALPVSEQNAIYSASFVSLPYADDAADLQDGTVVQVVLPRSALASFGLPATVYAGYADRVPADLILNEDGTPEAIRLVSQSSAQQNF